MRHFPVSFSLPALYQMEFRIPKDLQNAQTMLTIFRVHLQAEKMKLNSTTQVSSHDQRLTTWDTIKHLMIAGTMSSIQDLSHRILAISLRFVVYCSAPLNTLGLLKSPCATLDLPRQIFETPHGLCWLSGCHAKMPHIKTAKITAKKSQTLYTLRIPRRTIRALMAIELTVQCHFISLNFIRRTSRSLYKFGSPMPQAIP